MKKEVTRRKYWVRSYTNRSGEIGSFVVAGKLDAETEYYVILFGETEENFKFCLFLKSQNISCIQNGVFPDTLHTSLIFASVLWIA